MSTEKVKTDWFIASAFLGEAELGEGEFAVLTDHAEVYLRAMGAISWSEWQCLSTKSRAAFEEAGRRIDNARNEHLAELISLRLLAVLQRPEAVPS